MYCNMYDSNTGCILCCYELVFWQCAGVSPVADVLLFSVKTRMAQGLLISTLLNSIFYPEAITAD